MKRFALALVACLVSSMAAIADDACCDIGCDELDLISHKCGILSQDGQSSCCSTLCDGGCDAMGCLKGGCLGGLIKKSDHCFDDFISPTTNFVFFEDPRTLTEIRPIFVNHWIPESLGGGTIQLLALQFRIALSERLSLIAVKDGYVFDSTNGLLDTLLDSGVADVSAGLKYNLIRDVQRGTLLSGGFTYEIPLGEDDALQGLGDGEFHLFLSGGQRFLDGNAHWLSTFGWRLPVDDDVNTESVHWSNHFDVRVTERSYLFTELTWWHWTEDAGSGFLPVAGQDLFNLPATGIEGNDLVSQAIGAKLKPRRNVETSVAYEFPLTDLEDVLESRLTADVIFRY